MRRQRVGSLDLLCEKLIPTEIVEVEWSFCEGEAERQQPQ
jgi:hypothetical protein